MAGAGWAALELAALARRGFAVTVADLALVGAGVAGLRAGAVVGVFLAGMVRTQVEGNRPLRAVKVESTPRLLADPSPEGAMVAYADVSPVATGCLERHAAGDSRRPLGMSCFHAYYMRREVTQGRVILAALVQRQGARMPLRYLPPDSLQPEALMSYSQGVLHDRSRFAGCLLGGAVGDALGAPVEFMSRREILDAFGHRGLTGYIRCYGGPGRITDDTQMTLFTAEGLIRSHVRGRFRGISTVTGVTAHAYQRWLETQGVPTLRRFGFENEPTGWLFSHPELHSRRAPGNTCLSALRMMNELGAPARNDSKGCGGVMRVAPVGLFGVAMSLDSAVVFETARDLAALTHGHPSGNLSAGAFAVMVQRLVRGESLTDALAQARRHLVTFADHAETLQALDLAERLAAEGVPPEVAIPRLGEGWVAEEALAIAVYCALVGRNFRHALLMAVNHDGDSDSTGAIAGNLLGARDGIEVIPEEWLGPLELHNVIREIALDLHDCQWWEIGESVEDTTLNTRVWEKYPGF
jgi:ADP-ribosylglycohydrolase